jgi:hypothetical protein
VYNIYKKLRRQIMNSNSIYAILFGFIAIMYLSSAFGLKSNDKKRQQALDKVKVNSDNSVKTAHRTYKSINGYLSFTFYDTIVAAALSALVAILCVISTFFDFIGPGSAIVLYIIFNFYFYNKFKDIS